MALFKQGLATGDRVKEIDTIHGWRHAVEETLWLAQPGDLILVQADAVDETVEYVQARLSDDQAWQESPLSVMVMPVAAPLDRGAAQAQT
jgi:cyanophycin synthetase